MSPDTNGNVFDNDEARGRRHVTLTGEQLEARIINILLTVGGQPAGKLIEMTGQTAAATYLALGRLQERGRVDVGAYLLVTINPPRLPWYRRVPFGSVHPAWVLIAFLLLTTAGCSFWAAHRASTSHPIER